MGVRDCAGRAGVVGLSNVMRWVGRVGDGAEKQLRLGGWRRWGGGWGEVGN